MPSNLPSSDAITSTLGYESVLPVTRVSEDIRSSKYKYFEIVAGKNPFDEEKTPTPPPASAEQLISSAAPSPSPSPTLESGAVLPSPLLPGMAASQPRRAGWANELFAPTTPYSIVHDADLTERPRYVLDDADYAWCERRKVAPHDIELLFTLLEWEYVSRVVRVSSSPKELLLIEQNSDSRRPGDLPRCELCRLPVRPLRFSMRQRAAAADDSDKSELEEEIDPASYGFPCHDCGLHLHLQCWLLTEVPRDADSWVCDGCWLLSQHKRKNVLRCALCGRTDGVMVPYLASATPASPPPWSDSDGGADDEEHTTTYRGGSSNGNGSMPDTMCHLVCALAFPETAVFVPPTRLRRNGLVDRTCRPYVYNVMNINPNSPAQPSRHRFPKQKKSLVCQLCEREVGMCVHCSYPRCYETIHPSCASKAHTTECFITPDAVSSSASWQCFAYCPRHYNHASRGTGVWRQLSEAAESAVAKSDIAELLRRTREEEAESESAFSMRPRKRARGRPPSAVVQQREAYRRVSAAAMGYWMKKRRERRAESGQKVALIQQHVSPIVSAVLRPEIIKVSATDVRLTHFLSLVPEWQLWLISAVEHELPVPDDEYTDNGYRKDIARNCGSPTGSSARAVEEGEALGTTRLQQLYGMTQQLTKITDAMRSQATVRREQVEVEVEMLRLRCGWTSPP